jgi:hypothetical protein
MGSRRDAAASRALLVVAWLSATVIAGTVTWTAVASFGSPDRSAGDLLSQEGVRRQLRAVEATAVPPATSTTQAGGSPTQTLSTGSSTGHRPSTQPGKPSSPGQRSGNWSLIGGSVGASCDDGTIRLLYATPVDGWSMGVGDDGPDRIEVRFRDGGAESRLDAHCANGRPLAQIESDAGDGGDASGGESDREGAD